MGNCLVLQENMVRIMKTDGKILEYKKTPIKVHQVLNQFPGHAISDSLPVLHHLHPNTTLHNGQLYYLVPLPHPSPKATKKKVRFAEPEVAEGAHESGVVRIKLVISKQELHDILQKEGISIHEMLSLVHGEKGFDGQDECKKCDDGSQGWKPALESIAEVN
ncbi:uncharacterized protein LOC133305715 [Gastrolobium bilobum]|uniref:uncharacterized protein LOC133305715 n=1 Tax=Gastrolobium bilobum TaxID=150636 RepID=UPI002AB08EAA|nr:uncharacterized protein LOC133305715 [Gastrolobium bilobum]